MYKAVLILLAATTVMGDQNGGDLDAIMADIYGDNSTNIGSNTIKTIRDTSKAGGNSSAPEAEKEAQKCSLADGSEGRCVAYYTCDLPPLEPDSPIEIGVSDGEECVHYLDVCCPLQQYLNTVARKPEV